MIHIDRDRFDEQGVPIRPNPAWFQLARQVRAQAERELDGHKADRGVYAHDQVRMALQELFYDKCAYCEKSLADSEWDVEHFRPKGSVAERSDHPGYYWLAYEWSNLYPACKLCNQRRRERPRWGDLSQAGIGGKADQFPLADEATRTMSPQDDLAGEQFLLLDPCADDPEQHLRFDPLGQMYGAGPRGEATIDICFLNRRSLRDLRRAIVDRVAGLLKLIDGLESSGDLDAGADFRDFVRKHFLADGCIHAAVARYIAGHPDEFGL